MDSLTAKAVLQRNYLFRGLSESIIGQVAALATRREFGKGSIIFSQGDAVDALYGVDKLVDFFTQLSWTHTERDHQNGLAMATTGGDILYITPGVHWWATDKLSFRLQDQILAAHSVNEQQMLAENIISLAAVVQF